MKSRSETEGKGPLDRAAEGLLHLWGLSGTRQIVAPPLVTGTVLVALGIDVVVTLGAIVGGLVGGYVALGVGFIAAELIVESSNSPSDRLSRREAVGGWLTLVLVPSMVAFGATLLSARLLIGVSREIIGLALAVLCLLVVLRAWIDAVRRSAGESARHVRWLRDRAVAAAGDPEFVEQLQLEGWREDGPYDEMRAAYFRAWETVKEARRRTGRPIWAGGTEGLEPPPDDT